MKLFLLWLGLATGNFLYQLFNKRQWSVAFERSFFQGVALLLAHIIT